MQPSGRCDQPGGVFHHRKRTVTRAYFETFIQSIAAPRLRQSHIFVRDQHDHYVEPQWCAARLFAVETFGPPGAVVYDPACGWGRILSAAKDAGYTPVGADKRDVLERNELGLNHIEFACRDFLVDPVPGGIVGVVSNPSYHSIRQFCERAVEIAQLRVAILCPLPRVVAAHRWLTHLPLQKVLALSPRPSVPSADFLTRGGKAQGDRREYCWLLFDRRLSPGTKPTFEWLCRDGQQQ
jgi:hypothetical protein